MDLIFFHGEVRPGNSPILVFDLADGGIDRGEVEVDRVDSGRDLLRGAKIIEVRCWQENDGMGAYRDGHQPIPADGAAFTAAFHAA